MQCVEQPGVDGFDISGTMIPQYVIDGLQRFRAVATVAIIAATQGFVRVGIVKGQVAIGH